MRVALYSVLAMAGLGLVCWEVAIIIDLANHVMCAPVGGGCSLN